MKRIELERPPGRSVRRLAFVTRKCAECAGEGGACEACEGLGLGGGVEEIEAFEPFEWPPEAHDLRRLRRLRHLRLYDAAEALGLSVVGLSALERGIKVPVGGWAQIFEALGGPLTDEERAAAERVRIVAPPDEEV